MLMKENTAIQLWRFRIRLLTMKLKIQEILQGLLLIQSILTIKTVPISLN